MQYQDELNHIPHVREFVKNVNEHNNRVGKVQCAIIGHRCSLPGTLQSLTLLSTAWTFGAIVTSGGKDRRAT